MISTKSLFLHSSFTSKLYVERSYTFLLTYITEAQNAYFAKSTGKIVQKIYHICVIMFINECVLYFVWVQSRYMQIFSYVRSSKAYLQYNFFLVERGKEKQWQWSQPWRKHVRKMSMLKEHLHRYGRTRDVVECRCVNKMNFIWLQINGKKNTFTLESGYKNAGLINNTTDMDIDNHADLYKKNRSNYDEIFWRKYPLEYLCVTIYLSNT